MLHSIRKKLKNDCLTLSHIKARGLLQFNKLASKEVFYIVRQHSKFIHTDGPNQLPSSHDFMREIIMGVVHGQRRRPLCTTTKKEITDVEVRFHRWLLMVQNLPDSADS